MTIALWFMIILMAVYGGAFSISLWRDKNKNGSIVMMFMTLFILVAPYFVFMK
ncbi:hypothetical protein QE429_003446 [Bacillus sp. SORGH_AS 510]|uniref:hypothetical protein n=1 Tax=Bacillus sp. SORGH_AS_0510 TaxID=3041771 RepID=UPI00278728DB|nr:hypothetical protein [Bacillus sp. SORGH_AS_0510]MDQ1146619.1 hypothetical protein [Bacillus sp. SORGH_AS_0510]